MYENLRRQNNAHAGNREPYGRCIADSIWCQPEPDLERFAGVLESRCVPRQRDGLRYYLAEFGLEKYEPLEIIRKTEGRMAEDNCRLVIMEG